MAAVAAIPLQQQQLKRDVSEIVADPLNEYLPAVSEAAESQNIYLSPVEPVTESAEPVTEDKIPVAEVNAAVKPEVAEAATNAVPESAVLGENGYEYRTVREFRLRQRRDVSHLSLGYLPPLANPKLANSYLPPHLDVPEIPQLKIANEYLPPVNEDLPAEESTTQAAETQAPETESPTTEATATTNEAPITTEAGPVESAVFADDGYHYRKPAVLPDLGFLPLVKVAELDAAPETIAQPEPVQEAETIVPEPQPVVAQEPEPVEESEQVIAAEPERAYLPPLEEGVVEAEGPDGETAALLDDGYHYRVVKRVVLF